MLAADRDEQATPHPPTESNVAVRVALACVGLATGCWSSPPVQTYPSLTPPAVAIEHSVVSGRVLFAGKPVDRVVVAIMRGPTAFAPPAVYEQRTFNGWFRIVNLDPGDVTIIVASPGTARAFYLHQQIRRDVPIDLGDVVLPKGFTIHGTITNELGAPVANAEVSISQTFIREPLTPAQDLALGNLHTVTDSRGAYSIPAFTLIGEYNWPTLAVAAPDGRISWRQSVPTDNAVVDVVVAPKATLRVSITIPDVKAVTIASASKRGGYSSANMEPDGSFTVEVPSGDCVIESYLGAGMGPSQRVTAPAGTITTVTLP